MMQNLLFQQLSPNLGGLAGEIKVSAHGLSGHGLVAAEGVVVECIARLIELPTQTVVCLLEIEHLAIVIPTGSKAAKRIMLLKDAPRARLAGLIAGQVGVEAKE